MLNKPVAELLLGTYTIEIKIFRKSIPLFKTKLQSAILNFRIKILMNDV